MKKQISGVYYIENVVNGKQYIGSSKDVYQRLRRHMSELRRGVHHNTYLQCSVSKHGLTCFVNGILEECSIDQLLLREQFYLDTLPKTNLYNVSSIAGSGGHDAVQKPIYLLDLQGNILKEYESGANLARDLKLSIAPYPTFNKPAILKNKYRVVHKDFYDNNLDTIKSWKPYTSLYKHKQKLYHEGKFILTKDNQTLKLKTMTEVATHLGITNQAVSYKLKKSTSFIHKKSGYHVFYVKNYL